MWKSAIALLLATMAAPAFADNAAQRLAESPRHHEWVDVETGSGRKVRSFVVYPESGKRAMAVIVVHENRGLTDWVRGFADRVAEAGYIAVAPDLLSGFDAQHARTGDFASPDAAREAIYKLDRAQVMADLKAIQRWVANEPAADKRVAVVGFCWGGMTAFEFAAYAPQLSAALVFYGTAPTDPGRIADIEAPVYGFYGENDARVNETLPATRELMAQQRKTFEEVVYKGAGHAFMRAADDEGADAATAAAADSAWARVKQILRTVE